MDNVARLFENPPESMGYRGDPLLWKELAISFAKVQLPPTSGGLEKMLEDAFFQATGKSLSFVDEVYVQRFETGGMSSGYVSGEFWRESGFPLILRRYSSST